MPTANELTAIGENSLACVIGRTGGYRLWAARLGLPLKNTETHRGNRIEDVVADFLKGAGFEVERQTTKAPFDLLVDGVRVDVKSGSATGACGAHTFGSMKVPATCDMYIACLVDGRNHVLSMYFIPAECARVRTLSITVKGKCKYDRFKGAVDELRKMSERMERMASDAK